MDLHFPQNTDNAMNVGVTDGGFCFLGGGGVFCLK